MLPNMQPSIIPTRYEIIQSSQKNVGKSSAGRNMTLPASSQPMIGKIMGMDDKKIQESQKNIGRRVAGRNLWNIVRNNLGMIRNPIQSLKHPNGLSYYPIRRPRLRPHHGPGPRPPFIRPLRPPRYQKSVHQ